MRNFIITVDGKRYEVEVEEVGAASAAPAPSAPVAPAAPAAPVPAAPSAAKESGAKVLAPFPGLIKNLLCENGAAVRKDQPILVLEAMKMDNDITAPCDGTVSYRVTKGTNVESDAVLAVVG